MAKKEKKVSDLMKEIERRPVKELPGQIQKLKEEHPEAIYPEEFYSSEDFERARHYQHIQNEQDYRAERAQIIADAQQAEREANA